MNHVQIISKQFEEATAEQERILDAAAKDTSGARDLNAVESARFDELTESKKVLKVQLGRARQVESDKAESMQASRPAITQGIYAPENAKATADVARVYAKPKRHGPLKAFKGNDASERAEAAGMWAAATLYGNDNARRWCLERGINIGQSDRQAVLGGNNNSGAGYFVPDVMDTAIIEMSEFYGVFRSNAEVQPMTSDTWKGPRWSSGMVAYWIGRQAKPTSSDPAWDVVSLVAKDLAAMTKMERQLNEDSIVNLGDKITMALMLAFSYAEDNAGFNGDGTSTYGGITGVITKLGISANSASVVQAATGNNTIGALTVKDYLKVTGVFPEYPNAKPAWYCSKQAYANSMAPLMLAIGGTTPSDIAGGAGKTFLGYPVVISQVLPGSSAAAATIPIVFGDLALAAKLGDRRNITVESGFENDDFTKQMMTVLGTQRTDINVHTITDPKDSTKAGPVIGLKLAA
jgi:HK97 family phage major capsid protein